MGDEHLSGEDSVDHGRPSKWYWVPTSPGCEQAHTGLKPYRQQEGASSAKTCLSNRTRQAVRTTSEQDGDGEQDSQEAKQGDDDHQKHMKVVRQHSASETAALEREHQVVSESENDNEKQNGAAARHKYVLSKEQLGGALVPRLKTSRWEVGRFFNSNSCFPPTPPRRLDLFDS